MATKTSYSAKKLSSDPRLAKFIDNYQIIEAPAPSVSSSHGTMFPLGYPMIEFNLSDGWIKQESISTAKSDIINSTITCFTTKPFKIQPVGPVRIAVARLHPLALRKLLGTDIKKNTIFDPELVFGNSFRETQEKLALAKNLPEMKMHLDDFFINIFGKSQIRIDGRVNHLLALIIKKGGTINLHNAVKELGISQKRIEQLFNSHIGMPPKTYAGIVRFQKLLAIYEPHRSFTDLAYETGYYDQPHFIRHFREITNSAPKKFFKNECIFTCKISNLYNFSRTNSGNLRR